MLLIDLQAEEDEEMVDVQDELDVPETDSQENGKKRKVRLF